jgi:hypothetical protein
MGLLKSLAVAPDLLEILGSLEHGRRRRVERRQVLLGISRLGFSLGLVGRTGSTAHRKTRGALIFLQMPPGLADRGLRRGENRRGFVHRTYAGRLLGDADGVVAILK